MATSYGFHANKHHHSQSSGVSSIFGYTPPPPAAPPPAPAAAMPPPPPPVLPPLPEQPPRPSHQQQQSPRPNGTLIINQQQPNSGRQQKQQKKQQQQQQQGATSSSSPATVNTKPPPPGKGSGSRSGAAASSSGGKQQQQQQQQQPQQASKPAAKPRPAFGSVPERSNTTTMAAQQQQQTASAGGGAAKEPAARAAKLSEQKFDAHRQANILTTKRVKTGFATLYHEGGVPCRISHGASRMYLQWDRPPQYLPYDTLLPAAAEGLLETEHPFVFVSRRMLLEMLEAPGAAEKTLPLLERLVAHVRTALRSNLGDDTYDAALDALDALSRCVGTALNAHLNTIIVPLKRPPKSLQAKVHATLQTMHENGGDQALLVIKKHLPTF